MCNDFTIELYIYTLLGMKDLPTYYYLDHFHECLGFISSSCEALLEPVHWDFIQVFQQQPHHVQCTLARSLNRKSPLIERVSLRYDEIPDPEHALQVCMNKQWFSQVPSSHFIVWLGQLTKPKLLILLHDSGIDNILKSTPKTELIALAEAHLKFDWVSTHDIYHEYVYRNVDAIIDYLLFLFFGNVGSRLNQFSMRDLGVMKTRKKIAQMQARFNSIDEATSTYFYAYALSELKRFHSLGRIEHLSTLQIDTLPCAHGTLAKQKRNEYLWLYAKYQLQIKCDWQCVLPILDASELPEAQEKAIRLRYQFGDKEQVKQQLETIIEQPDNSHILAFAEDFLARKYQKKRTSVMTDMLRNSPRQLVLDEVHKHRVEAATVEHYQAIGIQALRTENELWRGLFGLTFWEIIFDPAFAVGHEFDWCPYHLRHNNLYSDQTKRIESLLTHCATVTNFKAHIITQATAHYGEPNGIFRWHKQILKRLVLLIEHADVASLIRVLRAMAQDYETYSDGFPDIMVISHHQVHFEEIKATGDSVRKNQLLTLSMLSTAGISVGITTVSWGINPMQPYVVVDIETTGGRAANHKITELGMLKVINGEVVDEYQTLLNPQRRIPRKITALTGIDDVMVNNAPIFAEVADRVAEFTKGCVFVAHNVNFDYGFIKQEFNRLDRHFSRAKLCTVREMRKAKPGLVSYSLANLTQHFGIEMSRHHRAMSDAVAANALLTIINEHRLKEQSNS